MRPEWLQRRSEDILWPELRIIDPHHHLWERPGSRYMLDELNEDLDSGHKVIATLYVQCRSMYRKDAEEIYQPVGEVEFANGIAAQFASGTYGENKLGCAGIIGAVDLTLGKRADAVIETMLEKAGSRLRGIRNQTAWHEHPEVRSSAEQPPPDLLGRPAFQEGLQRLVHYGLAFDVWAYHTQLQQVLALARATPDLAVVVDHVGGPLGVGPYASRQAEVYKQWLADMLELAKLPNVFVKLGGFGLKALGHRFYENALPPSSDQLLHAWQPYVAPLIEAFGPARCMFQSNFPVDKGMFSYHVMWNAFKKLSLGYSADDIHDLFFGTANRVYKLGL
jgi:L-fuconolactonase